MRGIKFRGKLKETFGDNAGNIVIPKGKWIYGGIVFDTDRVWIDVPYRGNLIVDKETVGQYTGLKDKNGNEIYEGDILSNGYEKSIVVWVKEQAGFMLKLTNKEYEKEKWTNPMIDLRKDDEVIGNIYENPELLEERIRK